MFSSLGEQRSLKNEFFLEIYVWFSSLVYVFIKNLL